jgi:hypothetical protein
MFNFYLYQFIAQKVCAFPVKTLCVLYENTVRFYRKGCTFLFTLKFSILNYHFYL